MKFLLGIVLVVCIFSAGWTASIENPADNAKLTSSDAGQTEMPTIVKSDDDDKTTTTLAPETTSSKDETTSSSSNDDTTTKKDDTTTSPTTTTETTTTVTPSTTTTPVPTTPSTTSTTTTVAPTTPAPVPTTTVKPEPPRSQWSTTSFIGGMVFAFGMMAIGFVSFKFYKARNERNYHTL